MKDAKFFCGQCLHEFPIELPKCEGPDGVMQHLCRNCRGKSDKPALSSEFSEKSKATVQKIRKSSNEAIMRSYKIKP